MSSHQEGEWVYSTTLSKRLRPLNEYIHELPSLPLTTELFVAFCGLAFNPVMIPFWPVLVYALSYRCVAYRAAASVATASRESRKWQDVSIIPSKKKQHWATANTLSYLASVLATLAFTEMGKALFATTRPRLPPEGYGAIGWTRRYGRQVASLKSMHSFPSGDCAQAMNLCMFLWRYVPAEAVKVTGIDTSIDKFLFGIFLPGVAFARVFYRCHWIEDCIGGILLSLLLHITLVPAMSKASKVMMIESAPWLTNFKIQ